MVDRASPIQRALRMADSQHPFFVCHPGNFMMLSPDPEEGRQEGGTVVLDYMIMPLKRYADFSGRSRRMEYWAFFLFNIIIMAVPVVLILAGGFLPLIEAMANSSGDPSMVTPEPPGPLLYVGFGLFAIYWLAILIPSIAVVVRRLHDRDMSGWWYLGIIIASFLPIVGAIASITLFVLMLLPGTPGPNRFGPDPKDPASAEVFA